MNKKSNKKLMAGLIALITLIIIGITCSGFLSNFKEGIKFLGISFGISAGLVLLLFIMKYIIKGADKLVGEGRTFNDRAIVLFSILILVSLTCRGFLKNFTLGIVFLIVSIAFVAITFLIMYGINSKKGEIKKAILAEKTSGEKMFILLTVLILISLTCGGFIQNLKAGILFLIISIISSLLLYLIVTEVKSENSIIGKIIRIETTFNQKMMILLSTIIMVSLTCGGFLRNLKAGIVFLMISIVFTASMLMLVLGVKSKHKIYDKIAGFETTFNEKMIILLTTMAMVSITSGGFLYNFKLGMLFLTISLIFSGLVLAGVISVRPRVNIFKMRARIQNLGKIEAVRAFGMIFVCIFVTYTLSGTWAYFTNTDEKGNEIEAKTTINRLIIGENVFGNILDGTLKIKMESSLPSPQPINMIGDSIVFTTSITDGECDTKTITLTNSSGTILLTSNTDTLIWPKSRMDVGNYIIKVEASNSKGEKATYTLDYEIKEKQDNPLVAGNISTSPVSQQTVNNEIKISVDQASGGKAPYTYKIGVIDSSGAEKTLSNSQDREVSWKPSEDGNYKIIASVIDSNGSTVSYTSIDYVIKNSISIYINKIIVENSGNENLIDKCSNGTINLFIKYGSSETKPLGNWPGKTNISLSSLSQETINEKTFYKYTCNPMNVDADGKSNFTFAISTGSWNGSSFNNGWQTVDIPVKAKSNIYVTICYKINKYQVIVKDDEKSIGINVSGGTWNMNNYY